MSNVNSKEIIRLRRGEMPLLQIVAERLGIRELLARFIKPHGNEIVSAVDTLMLLTFNITSGRQPLYELQEWVLGMDPKMFRFEQLEEGVFNDDRFGRALDKLYAADRASLMTEIVLKVVEIAQLDLGRIHNDSTTIKAFGKIPGKTRSGLFLARGHSKDHRPDLKQLVYSLTISADGGIPVHYKTYPGNRTDDTTHIETWKIVTRIAGRPDILYVADCKVCTDNQLDYIVRNGGRVVTIIPGTWSETRSFKEELRLARKNKRVILKRKLSGPHVPDEKAKYETFSSFEGSYKTAKSEFTIHWIHSSEKKKRDYNAREEMLRKTDSRLAELTGKINKRKLKTREKILQRVDEILIDNNVKHFYHIHLQRIQERYSRQIGKGRPGPDTRYEIYVKNLYALSWARNEQKLAQEKNTDGIFPLLSTDKDLTPKQTLIAYKYQPCLEKRFTQFKDIHNGAPILFKRIERVEAIMFLFFLALILQAFIEREVRAKMKDRRIEKLRIYPEHRSAYHPTTAVIFDRFHELSAYQLKRKGTLIKLKDSLSDIQTEVLELLGISEERYWGYSWH